MFWAMLALLSGSHVDLVHNPAELRLCAVGAEQMANQAHARGSDEVNVLVLMEISMMFVDRVEELGAADDAALAATRAGFTESDEQKAVLKRCGAIVNAMRGNDSLLDAARVADGEPRAERPAAAAD